MWLDNRVVTLLATNVQPTGMSMVHRKRKDGSTREVQCPAAVKLQKNESHAVTQKSVVTLWFV